MNLITILIAALGALAGPAALIALAVSWRRGRLSQPRAAQELVNTGLAMLKPLQERLTETEGRADRLERKLETAEQTIDTLTSKLRALTGAILAPDASIPVLRAMVARTTANGTMRGGE